MFLSVTYKLLFQMEKAFGASIQPVKKRFDNGLPVDGHRTIIDFEVPSGKLDGRRHFYTLKFKDATR